MEHDSPAAAEAGTATPASAQWLIFACSDHRFAVPLARIREIVTPRPFTRLPGSGGAVAGLIGVRSRVITAYDVGLALGRKRATLAPDHRVLLADVARRTLGLVVEEVCAVAALPLEPVATGALVIGSAEWDGTAVAALDLELLLERALEPVGSR